MKLNFDYYHNLENVELRLCNPDGRELFPISGRNRKLTLRFNDLSELSFDIDSTTTLSDGRVVELEVYDYIQTKRLVFATDIGWFQISEVDEHDNGVVKYKAVKAESYQAVLKNKGFLSEERVYSFFNPDDPYDDLYNSSQEDAIPSVLGQWSKQLGIKQNFNQFTGEPNNEDGTYDDWTVVYIDKGLIYGGSGSKCRTFEEGTTYGYDWIINDVEKAFEVIVQFDFMNKTIRVVRPEDVAQKTNVIFTFSNFMKNVDISERCDDIVTVLNCNGSNCDITPVNITGTNYICDFSYFMDETNHRWMSQELINYLKAWSEHCQTATELEAYKSNVEAIYTASEQKSEYTVLLQEASLRLQDMKNVQSERNMLGTGAPGDLCGTILAESVKVGEYSIDNQSPFYTNKTRFTGKTGLAVYSQKPYYDTDTKKWSFSSDASWTAGSVDSIIAQNMLDDEVATSYWYFIDSDDNSSYCKLTSKSRIDKQTSEVIYEAAGFERFIAYTYPAMNGTSGITYTDNVQVWIDRYEERVNELSSKVQRCESTIAMSTARVQSIAALANIFTYLDNSVGDAAKRDHLLRELNCYWIEGDYTNENIAVLDETSFEESLKLSEELLIAGKAELAKMCQPRLSFSLTSADVTKQYEFQEQMHMLELGKIITIEKEEGLWYFPALLEIAFNLDDSKEFSMKFANATRLDDWGYTYADLISDASSTSRKVSANWGDLTAYAKEREVVSAMIKNPLDTTLRASLANMTNQEFVVDTNGILGRRRSYVSPDNFEKEQMRIINNMLIFTDDNWKTAKTALGKIYYSDPENPTQTLTSYGLIAETIIGSLIMGEHLKIINTDSTISLDSNGITIKLPIYEGTDPEVPSSYVTVFEAAPEGKLEINTAVKVKDKTQAQNILSVSKDGAYIRNLTIDGKLKFAGTDYFIGVEVPAQGDSTYVSLPGLTITSETAKFSGELQAPSGTIGGFRVTEDEGEYMLSQSLPTYYPNGKLASMRSISLSPESGVGIAYAHFDNQSQTIDERRNVIIDYDGIALGRWSTDPGSEFIFMTITNTGKYPDGTQVGQSYGLYVDEGGIVRAISTS